MRTMATAVAAAALLYGSAAAQAQISVKLGVLNDRSGIYSDLGGEGSVIAARMAIGARRSALDS